MPTPGRAAGAYLSTQVQSSTPVERVVLLYDAALRAMAAARDAMARLDIPARRDAIGRALAIVSELQSTLNMTEGGEIAAQLDRLYAYVNARLLEATAEQDARPLEHGRMVLHTLRDAWRTLATRSAAGSAA
jgi:flagellar protein FliS